MVGGASGIGAACAQRLAKEGTTTVVADLDEDGTVRVASRITVAGGAAPPRRLDVTAPDAVTRVVEEAATMRGGLRIVVNRTGGMGALRPLAELPSADFDAVMRVNLYGVFHSMRCQPAAMADRGGVIANLSSIAARSGFRGHAAYAAAKQGVPRAAPYCHSRIRRPRHPGPAGVTRHRGDADDHRPAALGQAGRGGAVGPRRTPAPAGSTNGPAGTRS
ncbi:hypothetical protein GCM10020221_28620 [Streptomyces thioluteus]|uniref:Uncharacterized protein n=1 Tax=Streptomyces thioluteus TaxID=66431 RepID=A0ABP6JHE6_STRTU